MDSDYSFDIFKLIFVKFVWRKMDGSHDLANFDLIPHDEIGI